MAKPPATVPAAITAIDNRTPQFKALLPKTIPTDKFARVVKLALQRQPELLECNPGSIIEACERAAQDGLMLDGREAALVVYNTKDKKTGQWVKRAQYIPMWVGLLKRVRNSGELSSIQAYVVYDEEIRQNKFKYIAGDAERIEHEPIVVGDRGQPRLVYTIVRLKDGTSSREVMTWEEILAIARRSPKNVNKDTGELTGIWKSDTVQMAKKTVIRRHCNKLPMDSDTARVFQRMDELYEDDGGEAQPGEMAPPPPAETRAKQRGAAAAKLAQVETIDPETGEITEQPEPPEAEEPESETTEEDVI